MSKQRKRRPAGRSQQENEELLARRAQRLAAKMAELEQDEPAQEPLDPPEGPQGAVSDDTMGDVFGAVLEDRTEDAFPDEGAPEEAESLPEEPAPGRASEEEEPFELPEPPRAPKAAAREDEAARRAYEEGRPHGEAEKDEPVPKPAARRAGETPHRRRRDPEDLDREASDSALSDIDRAAAAFCGPKKKPRRARASTATRAMAILAGVLAVTLAALSTASIVLYNKYNPDKFIQSVITALADGDASLTARITSEDLGELDTDSLAPLTAYFSDAAARDRLKAQLEDQVMDPSRTGDAFPALGVQKTPVVFGYCDYKLTVHSVQLLLTSSAQNLLLNLDGRPRTGEPTAEGVLYKNLVPGRYEAVVTAADATGQQVTGTQTKLELFDHAAPQAFSGALPIGDLTISGCVNDEAVISVNGIDVAQKPVDGVVKLSQVAVGSVIGMTYTAPYGAVSTASVTFSDAAVTDLAFTNVQTAGGVPDGPTTDLMLAAYYASYLNGLNQRDPAQVAGITEQMRQQLAAEFADPQHEGKVYSYLNAVCNPATLQLYSGGEHPAFWCDIAAAYAYTSSSGEGPASGNVLRYQGVEFVYLEGQGWLINRTVEITEDQFNAGDVSALQPPAAPAA